MTVNDAHCHFFSTTFLSALARQRGREPLDTPQSLATELGWDDPGAPDALASRWVQTLDAADVNRCALIASVPGDEAAVADAVSRFPQRFVGFFMLDPSAPDALDRTRRALTELRLRTLCLFPAMNHVPLDDPRTRRVVEAAAALGAAVFVHCGVLSVGVRKKLGLPSRFDLSLGNPLAVATLALDFPATTFVIPHFGAGFFREALMAAEAAQNICLDTSSSNNWMRYSPGLSLREVFATAVKVLGASRVLFGTDSSFFPRGWQRPLYVEQLAAMRDAGLSDAAVALVLGGNFDRLFPSQERQ